MSYNGHGGPPPSGYAAYPGLPANQPGGYLPPEESHGYGPPPPNQHPLYPPQGGTPGQYAPPPGPPPTQLQMNGPPPNSGPFSDYNRAAAAPPQGMQHTAEGFGYQYSTNQGRRKALLIGINYMGSRNALGGCINDANAMARFLERNYNYKRDDMVILTDDQPNPRSVPTRANIIAAMHWLVRGAQSNDSLFFHYSGHGGETPDLDGDEDDGMDEVIYPVDFEMAGHIVDDEMHDIMVKPLPPGCRLTALFDSCHSGTALDLPYVYSTQGKIKEPNLAKDAGKGMFNAFLSYETGDLSGTINSLSGLFHRVTSGNRSTQITRQTKFSPADVISFSGCKDDQTSADSSQGQFAAGAMSYSFLEVLSRQPTQTYYSLLNNVRAIMQNKFQQKPQLSCSHPLDMNLMFTL